MFILKLTEYVIPLIWQFYDIHSSLAKTILDLLLNISIILVVFLSKFVLCGFAYLTIRYIFFFLFFGFNHWLLFLWFRWWDIVSIKYTLSYQEVPKLLFCKVMTIMSLNEINVI